MSISEAGAAVIEAEDEDTSAEPAAKSHRVKETDYSGKPDPFAQAFNSAKDEIEGEPKAKVKPKAEKEPEKAPAKAKPEAKKDDEAEKKAPERSYAKDSDAKPKSEAEAKPKDEEAPADAEKQKPKAKSETREPPKYWTEKRKEAFRFQPRDVQDEWLEAEPEPSERWPTDTKEAFKALPREAKEVVLGQIGEMERGFTKKFQDLASERQALAADRKLAEEIKSAVPPVMRDFLQQKGLTEAQALSRLMALQHKSMVDPVGYARQFIASNNINPADLIGTDGQAPVSQQFQAQQADVTSHPAFQALRAEYETLQRSIEQEKTKRAQEDDRRNAAELEAAMSETDGDGNSLYPYIRLLYEPMARIIETNPELFDSDSMGTKERISTAYKLALQDFPELAKPKRTAKLPPADEQVDAQAHAEPEDKRAEKLERAITPKSKTPTTIPTSSKPADPIDAAIASARKQLNR